MSNAPEINIKLLIVQKVGEEDKVLQNLSLIIQSNETEQCKLIGYKLIFKNNDSTTEYEYEKITNDYSLAITLKTKTHETLWIHFKKEGDFEYVKQKLKTPDQSKIEPQSIDQIQSIWKAMNNEFIETIFFKQFTSYLHNCAAQWVKGEIFAPIATLCQSSGHGKTKYMKEFSRRNCSAYLCLRPEGFIGCPERSKLASYFLESLNKEDTTKRFILSLVDATLDTIDKINKNKDKYEDISEELMQYQPWVMKRNYLNNDSSLEEKQKLFKSTVLNSIIKDQIATVDKLKTKMNDVLKDYPLFVLLDEAEALLSDSLVQDADNDYLDKLTVLRRVIKLLFRGMKIVFLLTDTTNKILNFNNTTEIPVTASCRLVDDLPVCSPYFKVFNTDIFSPVQQLQNNHTFIYDELKLRNPMNTIFQLGRPLWSYLIQNGYQGIVSLASNKLIFNTKWSNIDYADRIFAALSIFGSRTTILLNYKIQINATLVSKYMSTIFYVSEDLSEMHISYISEPILAHAAALLMQDRNDLNSILCEFNSLIKSSGLNTTGSIGEIVAELILLLAYDRTCLNINAMISSAVTVEDFLKTLIGDEQYHLHMNDLDVDLKKSLICFNHFIKRYDDLTINDTVVGFISRAAAGQFTHSHRNYDLFIPIVLENDTISYIFIQVKNRKDGIDQGILNRMNAENHYFGEKNNYISLCMSLGKECEPKITESIKEKMETRQTSQTREKNHCFLFNGLNVYPFLKDFSVILKMLVENDRNPNKEIYDIEVLKQVFVSSFNYSAEENK